MSQYCCVSKCNNKKGGRLFPNTDSYKLKWRVAIRPIDPVTKKLWTPWPKDRVCRDHFKPQDFKKIAEGKLTN